MNLIRNYRNWRAYRDTVDASWAACRTASLDDLGIDRSEHPRGRAQGRSSIANFAGSTSSQTLTDTVSFHLLPKADHQNGARRTSSRGGRCYHPKGFAPFQYGERNFVQNPPPPGD